MNRQQRRAAGRGSDPRTKSLLTLLEFKREDFRRREHEYDQRFAALPTIMQERIRRFRANSPDFRWRFEFYELGATEMAVRLASAFSSAEEIRDFATRAFPIVDDDIAGKMIDLMNGPARISPLDTGRMFRFALELAAAFRTNPDAVLDMCGASCSLSTCAVYCRKGRYTRDICAITGGPEFVFEAIGMVPHEWRKVA